MDHGQDFQNPFNSKYYNLEFLFLFQNLQQLNIKVNIGYTISIFKYIIYQTIRGWDTAVYDCL